MSEHAIQTPKRFTISPSLTDTTVRIWGPKTSNMSKNPKSFLNYTRRYRAVLGSHGGPDDMKTAQKLYEHLINSGLIGRNFCNFIDKISEN